MDESLREGDGSRSRVPDLSQMLRVLKGSQGAVERIRQLREKRWTELLGDKLNALLASQEAAESVLDDRNPRIREGALLLLTYHWHVRSSAGAPIKRLAINDLSADVRAAAIDCLAHQYANTGDKDTSCICAKCSKNELEATKVRCCAYFAFLKIQGVRPPVPTIIAALRTTNTLPDELDWLLVESFLAEHGER